MRTTGLSIRARVLLTLCAVAMATAVQAGKASTVDWPSPAGDAQESGFSPLDAINTRNIARLGLAWSLDLEGESTLEATPMAVDGVLYFSGSYAAVYAVDAVTGTLLWKYDPKTWKHAPAKMTGSLPVNRGVAYANGRVFVGRGGRPPDSAGCARRARCCGAWKRCRRTHAQPQSPARRARSTAR